MKHRVNWQFNRGFRIQRTLPTKREAIEYCQHVLRLWGIKAKMKKV